MLTFIWLLAGHFAGDVLFQGLLISRYKREKPVYIIPHVIIYTLTLSILLHYLVLLTWWKPLLLLISHFAIDYWKCYIAHTDSLRSFCLVNAGDQILHLIVLGFMLV